MPAGYQQISTLTKGQKGVHGQFLNQLKQMLQGGGGANIQQNPLYQQGSGFLQNLLSGSPESSQAFEAPAIRQFQEQTIPRLAERFSGLGAGAQSSSAFQQALGQAGASLSEQLQALRSGLQMQALPQALGYAQQPSSNALGFGQLGLGTQAFGYAPKQKPFWQELLQGGATSGAQGLSQLLPLLFLL